MDSTNTWGLPTILAFIVTVGTTVYNVLKWGYDRAWGNASKAERIDSIEKRIADGESRGNVQDEHLAALQKNWESQKRTNDRQHDINEQQTRLVTDVNEVRRALDMERGRRKEQDRQERKERDRSRP